MAETVHPIEATGSQQVAREADLPMFFDPATCVRKGLCPVMKLEGAEKSVVESHSLYYEIHGTGKEKIVFIMGLNSSSFAWESQVPHFSKNYTVLVFDNRGVGNSDSPKGPYSTTEMANDVITLVDYLGWNNGRELHIVGVSLGGMISQELALRIPDRILSITLIVTKAGSAGFLSNMTPWKGMTTLAGVTFSKDDDYKASQILTILYPAAWLDAKSDEDPAKTNREMAKARLMHRISVQRKQTLVGALSQTAAANGHNVSADKLRQIDTTIPKIFIVTGDDDSLVKPVNSEWLHTNMPRAEYQVWHGFGHGLVGQDPKRFNETLERIIAEGRERASKGPWA